MKKRSMYDNLTASDLAMITRERGLEKPQVVTLGEWAAWLEEQDKAAQAEVVEAIGAYDGMTNDELREEAYRRGALPPGEVSRQEIVDSLEAADGMTEEAQAEADGVPFTDEVVEKPTGRKPKKG